MWCVWCNWRNSMFGTNPLFASYWLFLWKDNFFFLSTEFTDVCRNHTCKQEHTIDAGKSRSTHTCPLSFTETAARGGWTQREVDAVSPTDQCQIEFRPGGLLGLVTRWFTSLSVPCFTGKGSTELTGKKYSVPNCALTLILLTWRIWWAPNNASRWEMGYNSAFNLLAPEFYI